MSERPPKKRVRPTRKAASKAPPPGEPAPGVSLSSLLEALPGAFFALDAAWRFTYVSPGMARLLDGALLGRELGEAGPALHWLQPHLRLQRPASAQSPAVFEHTWAEHDATYEVHLRPLEGGLLVHLRDRTERQRAEEALHAEFHEQLVGIVSHDIRSPLGAIINWSRVLAEGGNTGEDPQRTSRRITAAAVRIERLTRLLLDFTRARLGGGISIEPRHMDLHELFDKVAHEFRVAYPGRAVECVREGDGRGLWDPDRLGQVLSNLVENALKYSPEDVPVRLVTRGERDSVVLEVHNRGRPIPPDVLPHLFEPFRRGPQTTRTLKVSYGLGLYIVREIVRAHGGTISVHSSEREGTTLSVRLPRQPPGAVPGGPPPLLPAPR